MKRFLIFAAGLGMFIAVYRVLGLSESLPEPRLFFRKSFDTNRAAQVQAALRADDAKYLGGLTSYWEPDFSTTLAYGGDTAALNAMIERLARLDGMNVRLTFSRDLSKETGSALPSGSWWIRYAHTAPNTLTVRINLAAENLKLDALEVRVPAGRN